MAIEHTLIELEERYWESAGDADFYRENLADEAVMVFMVGILNKDKVVKSQEKADRWSSFTIDDPEVVMISDHAAALVYTTVAVQAGTEAQYVAAVSSVYALRDGEWTLVLHQQTPLDI